MDLQAALARGPPSRDEFLDALNSQLAAEKAAAVDPSSSPPASPSGSDDQAAVPAVDEESTVDSAAAGLAARGPPPAAEWSAPLLDSDYLIASSAREPHLSEPQLMPPCGPSVCSAEQTLFDLPAPSCSSTPGDATLWAAEPLPRMQLAVGEAASLDDDKAGMLLSGFTLGASRPLTDDEERRLAAAEASADIALGKRGEAAGEGEEGMADGDGEDSKKEEGGSEAEATVEAGAKAEAEAAGDDDDDDDDDWEDESVS